MLARTYAAPRLPVHAVPATQLVDLSKSTVSVNTREFSSFSGENCPTRCVSEKRGVPAWPRLVVMITTPFVARDPYIDDAAALFSTSMDSMSAGFTSARRLTMLSWVLAGAPPDALVIEFAPPGIETLLIRTPSTTNNGSPLSLSDVTPRIWICPPPPGAPLFMLMRAPTTLP